jgi:mxaK protein
MKQQRVHVTGRLLAHIQRAALRLRTPMLALLCAVSIAAFGWATWRSVEAARDNAAIRAIVAGEDVAIDPKRASGEVVVARVRYLLDRDMIDDAQTLLDSAAPHLSPSARSRALYNLANWRTRRAMNLIQNGELDKAIPQTKLAKDDYRRTLTLDPAAWDAKHNLDVASRLVRDLPTYEQEGEEVPPDAKTKLWTDLPGVPRGLP